MKDAFHLITRLSAISEIAIEIAKTVLAVVATVVGAVSGVLFVWFVLKLVGE